MREHVQVKRAVFRVTLSGGQMYVIVGHLFQSEIRTSQTLQVLIHGATYAHQYWDIPSFNGRSYSYARYMAERGYAVLALDMLGTGESSQPAGDSLNLQQTAEGVHQVLVTLRRQSREFAGGFKHIALIGHSTGSVISTLVQGRYGSADAIVNTGIVFSRHPSPMPISAILKLVMRSYVSFSASLRTALFYHLDTADPAVIDHDNRHLARTFARRQFLDGARVSISPSLACSAAVACPVLIQLGEKDVLEPPSYLDAEPAHYPRATSIHTRSVPGCGHSLNGHPNAPIGWAQIDEWLRAILIA